MFKVQSLKFHSDKFGTGVLSSKFQVSSLFQFATTFRCLTNQMNTPIPGINIMTFIRCILLCYELFWSGFVAGLLLVGSRELSMDYQWTTNELSLKYQSN